MSGLKIKSQYLFLEKLICDSLTKELTLQIFPFEHTQDIRNNVFSRIRQFTTFKRSYRSCLYNNTPTIISEDTNKFV